MVDVCNKPLLHPFILETKVAEYLPPLSCSHANAKKHTLVVGVVVQVHGV